jgi:hypothetical protein
MGSREEYAGWHLRPTISSVANEFVCVGMLAIWRRIGKALIDGMRRTGICEDTALRKSGEQRRGCDAASLLGRLVW